MDGGTARPDWRSAKATETELTEKKAKERDRLPIARVARSNGTEIGETAAKWRAPATEPTDKLERWKSNPLHPKEHEEEGR